jgi:hypothetical protein
MHHSVQQQVFFFEHKGLRMNFKSFITGVAVLGAVVFTTNSFASEQVVATIMNDETKNSYKLVIDSSETDDSIKTFYKDIFQNGRRLSREVIDMKILATTGMVAEQRDKHIVLRLKSSNFDLDQGGIIEIDTLYNGIKNERRSYQVQLAKSKVGWALFKSGRTIKEIYIQTNRVFALGAVGIKNIVMK